MLSARQMEAFQLDFQRAIMGTVRAGCSKDKGHRKGTWVDSSFECKEERTHQHPLSGEGRMEFLDDLAPCPRSVDRDQTQNTEWSLPNNLNSRVHRESNKRGTITSSPRWRQTS